MGILKLWEGLLEFPFYKDSLLFAMIISLLGMHQISLKQMVSCSQIKN